MKAPQIKRKQKEKQLLLNAPVRVPLKLAAGSKDLEEIPKS